ncbi:MAG: hypothetical protein Q7K29_05845 [Thermoleophilia bacterium]|nr:hypothetical protein [Thermoleophilia bacterium]
MTDAPTELTKLIEAEKTYQSSVKEAKKVFKETNKVWAKKLKEAEKSLNNALRNESIDRFGKIKLFEDRIESPEGTAFFTNGEVKAEVEAEGNLSISQRPTVTRWACCGCFSLAMPKKTTHDSRQLFLTITAPGVGLLVKSKLPDSKKIRQFAVNVNSAYQSAEVKKKSREDAVKVATSGLETVKKEMETSTSKAKETLSIVIEDKSQLNDAILAAENQLSQSENKKLAAEVEKAKKLLLTESE